MSNPKFDCCGDREEAVYVDVPSCREESSNCNSHKGKFYDRLTEPFVVPSIGNDGRMYVCEPKLWAKCQWIAACIGAEKIAAFQILEVTNTFIRVLNGCRTGESILGNPDPSTEIKEGSVIYPVPPQGCGQGFCSKVAEAIKDCGVYAIKEVLEDSDEICFTSVPVLDETEKAHLFGGTMPEQDCECDEYGYGAPVQGESLWKSCLRKLRKIFTTVGGASLCMPEAPDYNPETDESNLAREAVFDKKGCLRKGGAVGDCRNAITIEEDEVGADGVIVCKEGTRRLLAPDCNKIIVGCCDEDNENPKWVVKDKGLMYFPLEEPIEIFNESWADFGTTIVDSSKPMPATINKSITIDEELIPNSCGKVYALVDFQTRVVDTASASVVNTDVSYNGEYYRKVIAGLTNDVFGQMTQDVVPLKDDDPTNFQFKWDKISGTATYKALVRILGFYA